jgi:integrase
MADAPGRTTVLPSPEGMGHAVARVAEAATAGAGIFVLLARWQRFLDVSGRCNPRTRKTYRRIVTNFFADLYADDTWEGPRDPLAITEDDAVAYIYGWTAAKGEMRGQTLRALRSFYAFCEDREEIHRSPFRHLKPGRPKYEDAPFLTPAELRELLRAAELVDPRARWAIQLQYATGARVGAIVALQWSDIRGGRIRILDEKADESRGLPLEGLAAEAVSHLRELATYQPTRGRRRDTPIGVGYERYRQWLKEAGERAGVDVFTHLLRHTRATDLARMRTDDRTMMTVFGWKDPRMIKKYAAPYDPHIREAMALPIPQ